MQGRSLPIFTTFVWSTQGSSSSKQIQGRTASAFLVGLLSTRSIEYTATSRDNYTNGIDIHGGANWIIRNNLFKNMRAPQGQLAGPAILMWNGASNTLVEGNTFVNCEREISFGPGGSRDVRPHRRSRANNVVPREPSLTGDAGILIADSSNTKVLHNSILLSGTYSNAIEYRFAGASGLGRRQQFD